MRSTNIQMSTLCKHLLADDLVQLHHLVTDNLLLSVLKITIFQPGKQSKRHYAYELKITEKYPVTPVNYVNHSIIEAIGDYIHQFTVSTHSFQHEYSLTDYVIGASTVAYMLQHSRPYSWQTKSTKK